MGGITYLGYLLDRKGSINQ